MWKSASARARLVCSSSGQSISTSMPNSSAKRPHLAAHGGHQGVVAGAAVAQAGDQLAQRGHLAVDQVGQGVDVGAGRVVGRDAAQGHASTAYFRPR
jgi:hypothetical protein